MAAMLKRPLASRIATIVFGIISFAHLSAQQPKTGRINGHVVDSVGATIKGASVFVRRHGSTEDDLKAVTHTDINGDFMLVLPEGGYDVLVTSPAFVAGVQTIPILPGKTKRAQWKLRVLGCDFPGMNCDTFQ
jgi:hypothetical protein